MKAHRYFRLLPLLAISGAAADTFELKDGTKLEGSIVKEDGSDYIIMVQVTKSIRDERRVPKADVAKHVAEKKDETAFAAIAKAIPVPDHRDEAYYALLIGQTESFIKNHATSPKLPEAMKILDLLENELAVINSGGVKFGGKVISAAQRAPKAYGLDAGVQAAKFKEAADRGDPIAALRAWALLETGFPGSKAYRDNLPKAVSVMKAQLAAVTSTLAGFDARTKSRAAGLAGMGNDRGRIRQAIEEEQAAYAARIAQEKAAGIKWLSQDPYVKAPMDEAKRMLDSEIRRLENLDPANLPKTEQAYEDAYAEITRAATKQELEAALSKARSSSMPPAYLDLLTKAAPVIPAP